MAARYFARLREDGLFYKSTVSLKFFQLLLSFGKIQTQEGFGSKFSQKKKKKKILSKDPKRVKTLRELAVKTDVILENTATKLALIVKHHLPLDLIGGTERILCLLGRKGLQFNYKAMVKSAHGVMVIVVGNGHDDASSHPGAG